MCLLIYRAGLICVIITTSINGLVFLCSVLTPFKLLRHSIPPPPFDFLSTKCNGSSNSLAGFLILYSTNDVDLFFKKKEYTNRIDCFKVPIAGQARNIKRFPIQKHSRWQRGKLRGCSGRHRCPCKLPRVFLLKCEWMCGIFQGLSRSSFLLWSGNRSNEDKEQLDLSACLYEIWPTNHPPQFQRGAILVCDRTAGFKSSSTLESYNHRAGSNFQVI